MWSLAKRGNHLVRVTVASGQVDEFEAGVDLGGGTFADLAVGPNAVWVAHSVAVVGGVDHLQATTGEVVQHVPFPLATSVDVGGGRVWSVAPGASDEASWKAPRDRPGRRPSDRPTDGDGYATRLQLPSLGGSVWVANRGDDTVSRVDAATRAVEASIPVGDQPALLSAGAGSVWVGQPRRQHAHADRRGDGRGPGAPISLGKEIDDLAVSEQAVWVAAADGTVTRLDPDSGEVVGSPLGTGPGAALAGGRRRNAVGGGALTTGR